MSVRGARLGERQGLGCPWLAGAAASDSREAGERALAANLCPAPAAGVLDFLVGWMLGDPACRLSAKNVAEAEIVDPRPVTHIAELAAQPRVCLQACWGPEGDVG